jgi:hypothetical protein
MKIISILLFMIICNTTLFSQNLTNDNFVGTWKVVNAQLMPDVKIGLDTDGLKMMEEVRKGFIGTIFKFELNNKFTIKFPNTIPEFMKELEFLNNQKWKLGEDHVIVIGSEKDGYSLMNISVKNEQEKKYFILDETPLILEVIQQPE